mgnify:CR=1 FL=1
MLMNSAQDYGLVSKVLHWLIAIMILTLIAVGAYMSDLDKDAPARAQIYGLHKAFGVTVLGLAGLHIAGALNVPLDKLKRRLKELPRDREIVAYCRGPWCVLSYEAVARLREEFRRVGKPDGVPLDNDHLGVSPDRPPDPAWY